MGGFILLAHFFNVHLEFDLFLITDFLFLHSLNGSFLDLVNDNLSSLLSSIHFSDFSLLLFLKDLKSFNFHHEVEFLLFFDPFRFETLILIELLVSDSDNLGVEDHLVHLFDVIHLIIKLFLGF